MGKRRLYVLELSDVFDNQVYLPYSSGVVLSYAFAQPEIKQNYELIDWFYYRQEAEKILERIHNPDVVGFSCFIWNWELSLTLAKQIKEKYPECLIFFGGQQQPLADRVEDFFEEHPYVDVLVHGEGEETVVELLNARLNNETDFSDINGITFHKDKMPVTTFPRPRMDSIDEHPSPYLDGLFDKIIKEAPSDLKFNATVESARGCPFSCAFCEIGTKYYVKVKKNYSKIKDEIKWLVKHKIEYITDANSNFGLYYKPDLDLAQFVRDIKAETGYPHAYRVTWVKGRADKVLDIALVLEEAEVQKGMTIALQSMNPEVLKAIARKNVDGGKLQEFIEMYESAEISSYVELIWGLPKETLESFIEGVASVLEYEYHTYLDIHLMMPLINTPFSRKDYIEEHGIEYTLTQPRFHHRHIDGELVEDLSKFVIKTNDMSTEDWMEGHQFRWLMIFGHYLGPTQFLSRFVRKYSNIAYQEFYTKLLNYIKHHPDSFLGREYWEVRNNLSLIMENKRHWGVVIPEISDINWSVDEGMAIKIALNYDEYEANIRDFMENHLGAELPPQVLNELLQYQQDRLNHMGAEKYKETLYQYNIHQFIEEKEEFQKRENKLQFESCGIVDNFDWAKQIIWFNRRTGGYKTKVTHL